MTKSNNEWVPELGKEYLLVSMGMCRMNEPVKITYTGKGVGCYERLSDGMEFTYAANQTVFKEIKTEAEKRRDELKLYIMDALTKQGQHSWQDGIADALIDAGLIKPKPLTSHDLKDFWNSHGQAWSWDLMAERINSHIRGENK